MKIQIITNRLRENYNGDIFTDDNFYKPKEHKDYQFTFSKISSPKTLSSFDINIIDMQDNDIWKSQESYGDSIIVSDDLERISKNIAKNNNFVTIISFPLDICFEYYINSTISKNRKPIKDMLSYIITDYNKTILGGTDIDLLNNFIDYEYSESLCNNKSFISYFYFNENRNNDFVNTRAKDSNNPTTVKLNENIILTALNLFDENVDLKDFFIEIGLDKEENNSFEPDWVKNLNYFDDEKQKNLIKDSKQIIEKANKDIENAQIKLNNNAKFKRCLYTNDKYLVKIVFKILEKILDYDLSKFKDKKEEDVRIDKNNITFLGEIKGINTNVGYANVSQANHHVQVYKDKVKNDLTSNIPKGLLIINTFKDKPLEERVEVERIQIAEAIKYNVLIILTKDLLKLFEMFENKQVTTEQIIKVFAEEKGLFTLEMIK